MCSHSLQEQKSHTNETTCKISILFLSMHAFSNVPLVFAVSLKLITEKWNQLFTETVLAFNLHFQHKGMHLQENQVHHSKEHKEKIMILYLFVFVHDLYL
jgi:hypothetical protein